MLIIKEKETLIDTISQYREKFNSSVGFVPTMGFLHQGHASLVKKSKKENGLTVCDIFVNPLQFNDIKDFENYPSDIQNDVKLLESLDCDILYLPKKDDIYPKNHNPSTYNFENLNKELEGNHRPGHFQGVAEVVKILFDIVRPDKAYFGEKDYQQLLIIKMLVEQNKLPIEIIPVETIRENDGLAMSSRNSRLTKEEREKAPFIFTQLKWCSNNYLNYTPYELKKIIKSNFQEDKSFRLEYIEFANRENLTIINNWEEANTAGAFIAVWLGEVRLIDNIILF